MHLGQLGLRLRGHLLELRDGGVLLCRLGFQVGLVAGHGDGLLELRHGLALALQLALGVDGRAGIGDGGVGLEGGELGLRGGSLLLDLGLPLCGHVCESGLVRGEVHERGEFLDLPALSGDGG